MADVAVILHFSIAEMSAMDLPELMAWRQRAVERSGAKP